MKEEGKIEIKHGRKRKEVYKRVRECERENYQPGLVVLIQITCSVS